MSANRPILAAAMTAAISLSGLAAAQAADSQGALLSRFRPIIYLHADEQYRPMAVTGYFTGKTTRMVDGKTTLVGAGKVTMERIYEEYVKRGKTFSGGVHFLNDDAVKAGDRRPARGQSLTTPIYGVSFEHEGSLYLQYAIFYGYNGMYPLSILGVTLKKNLTGAHWGDIEHVTIRLNQKRNAIAAVFFAAHGGADGMRLEGKSLKHLEREGERPVLYSAVNGHGSYPRAGAWVRLATTGTDVTGKGTRWNPSLVRVFPDSDKRFDPKTMGWMYVPGQIGPDGISPLASKDWFMNPSHEKPAFKPLENWCKSTKDTLCLLSKMGGKAQWAPIVAEIKGEMKKLEGKIKDGVKTGVKKVGDGVKTGAKKVGDGVKTGAKKAGDGVKKGANKVKEGAKKVGKKLKKLFGG
jgi:hypothetical protein